MEMDPEKANTFFLGTKIPSEPVFTPCPSFVWYSGRGGASPWRLPLLVLWSQKTANGAHCRETGVHSTSSSVHFCSCCLVCVHFCSNWCSIFAFLRGENAEESERKAVWEFYSWYTFPLPVVLGASPGDSAGYLVEKKLWDALESLYWWTRNASLAAILGSVGGVRTQ